MHDTNMCVVLFKQKTAYEMHISDWSSDVCSSDLLEPVVGGFKVDVKRAHIRLVQRHDGAIADHVHISANYGIEYAGFRSAHIGLAGFNARLGRLHSIGNGSAPVEGNGQGHTALRK